MRFAKSELKRCLGRLALSSMARRVKLRVGERQGLEDDGFAVIPGPHGCLEIVSRQPRGVLYGVYALLEALGFRWYFPGQAGESPPAKPDAWPTAPIAQSPAFRYRSVVDVWRKDSIRELMDFAARARYNRFYLHTTRGLKHAARLARQRGLEIGVKLHVMSSLLPRTCFREHPEWFRVERGERTKQFNLCVSDRSALREVTRRAEQLATRIDVDVTDYSFWQDDARGAWCECRKCRKLSPSDQNVILMTAVLRGVRRVSRAARVCYLAYVGMTAPPEQTDIPDGLVLEFAP